MYDELLSVYNMAVFCRKYGDESNLSDYIVVLYLKNKNVIGAKKIVINVEQLLYLTSGKMIASLSRKERILMYALNESRFSLDVVEITDKVSNNKVAYIGFHKFREIIRYKLCKSDVLRQQVEQINREISLAEIQEYRYYYSRHDEQEFFAKYFHERFPKSSKEKFNGNIRLMFTHYFKYFLLPCLPIKICPKTIVRTKYRDIERTDYYRYSFDVEDEFNCEFETLYFAKAVVCTVLEMNIFFPGINDNIAPSDKQ